MPAASCRILKCFGLVLGVYLGWVSTLSAQNIIDWDGSSTNDNWTRNSNWGFGSNGDPDGANDIGRFLDSADGVARFTVDLNQDRTIGGFIFDSSDQYTTLHGNNDNFNLRNSQSGYNGNAIIRVIDISSLGQEVVWDANLNSDDLVISQFDTGATFTLSGNFNSDAGEDIFIEEAGLTSFSGVNSFAGDLFINGGNLSADSVSALGGTPNLEITNGGSLNMGTTNTGNAIGNITIGEGSISGSATLLFDGTFTKTNTGTNTTIAAILGLDNGTSQTFSIDTDQVTLTGGLSGSGTLNKTGSGDLVINGSSTAFSGDYNLQAGGLSFTAANIINSGSDITVTSGTLDFSTFDQSFNNLILNSDNVLGSGTLTINGGITKNNTATSVTINPNLAFGASTPNISVANGAAAQDLILAGNLSGTAGFTKQGTGTLVLNGSANNLSGTLAINGGILEVTNANSINNTATISLSGATVDFGSNNETFGTLTSAAGNVNGSGTLTITNGLNITATSGATTINPNLALSGNYSIAVTDNGSQTNELILNGDLTGSGTFAKSGTGRVLLNGDATGYTGDYSISGGSLALGASNLLNTGSDLTLTGGSTFDLSTFNQTITNLNLSEGTIDGSGLLTVSGTFSGAATGQSTINTDLALSSLAFNVPDTVVGYDLTINGALSGSTAFSKTGAGGLLIGGTVTSSSTTYTVSGGLLGWGASDLFDDNADFISNGGSLDLGIYSETINSLTLNSSNVLGSGTLTLSSLTKNATGTNVDLAPTLSLSGTRSINVAGDSLGLSGGLTGSGTLQKTGVGELSINADSTAYTGNYEIQSGTFSWGASNVINNTSNITSTSGILNLGTNSDTIGNLTLNNANVNGSGTLTVSGTLTKNNTGTNVTFNPTLGLSGTSPVVVTGDTLNIAGGLSGSGTLQKTGAGKLTISGSSDAFTGDYEIQAGNVDFDTANINDGSDFNLSSGATVSINQNETIGNLTGTGTFDMGSSNLVVTTSGTSSFSGTIGSGSASGNFSTAGSGTYNFGGTIETNGSVTVNNTTFNLNGSTEAIGSASGISVSSGSTLQLSSNNLIGNSVPITLDGGTLTFDGVTDSFGILSTTNTSTLNFGSDFSVIDANDLTFASFGITINGWNNGVFGGAGGDRLLSANPVDATTLSNITFNGFSSGAKANQISGGVYDGYYEIIPDLGAVEWVGGGAVGNENVWFYDANWDPNTRDPQDPGTIALFGPQGTAYPNVNLPSNKTIGQLYFQEDTSYTISGTGELTFDNNGSDALIYVGGTGSHAINSNIALDDNLVINQTESTTTFTLGGVISGSNNISLQGDGTTRFSGANTYTGTTTINGTTLRITNSSGLGGTGSGTTLTNGGTLELAYDSGVSDEALSFANGANQGTLLSVNTGTNREFSGDITFNGTATDESGALILGKVAVESGNTLEVSGNLTGTGGLEKSGLGTLVIDTTSAGNNTYSGGTKITEGRISIGTNTNSVDNARFGSTASGLNYLGTGDITIGNGGEFFVYSSTASDVDMQLDGKITVKSGGLAVFELADQGNNHGLEINGDFVVESGGKAYINVAGDEDFRLEAGGTLDVLGDMTIISDDDISIFGDLNINGAHFCIISYDDFQTTDGADNTITVTGGSEVTILTSFEVDGDDTTPGFHSLTDGTGSFFILDAGDVIQVEDVGSVFNILGGNEVQLEGEIRWKGQNEFNILRTPETILYSTTILDGGTETEKGTFRLSGILDVGNLNNANILNSPNLTLTTDQYDVNYSLDSNYCGFCDPELETTTSSSIEGGPIYNLGDFTKEGSGTSNLTLTNDYVGAINTFVENGTLALTQDNQIRGTSGSSTDYSNLSIGTTTTAGTLDATDTDQDFEDISFEQGKILMGTGTLTIQGDSVSKTNTNGQGFIGQDSSGTGFADITLANTDLTVDVGNGSQSVDLLWDANVSTSNPSGTNLVKTGDGTFVITGQSDTLGDVTANGGVLNLQGTGNTAISNTDTLTINNSAEVILNDNETIGSLAGNGGTLTMQGNNLTTGGDNSNTTFSGVITGTGTDLTKTGTGTFTLDGTNTLTGNVTVSNGTLELNNATNQALGAVNSITVGAGAALVIKPTTNADGQVNSSANLILNGGDLTLATREAPDPNPSANIDETFNNLTLGADSNINYAGDTAILTFAGANSDTNGNTLTIKDWDGIISGGGGSQQLLFSTSIDPNDLIINFEGFDTGFEFVDNGNGFYEILPNFTAQVFEWNGTSNQWDFNNSWISDPEADYPDFDSTGDLVLFDNTGSGQTTVALDGNFSIGFMEFNESTAYTIGDDGTTRTIDFNTGNSLQARMTLGGTANQTIDVNLENDDTDGLIIAQGSSGLLEINGDLNTKGNPLIIRGTGDTQLDGNLSGTGSLTKSGNGTLTFTQNSNSGFSGDVDIQSGTVQISGSGSLGTGTSDIQVGNAAATGNAQLLLTDGSNSTNLTRNIDIVNSPVETTLGGNFNSGTAEFSGNIDLGTTVTGQDVNLTSATGGTTTFSGVISGGNGIDKIGGGTVVLSGANTFTGNSTLQEGTLQINSSASLGNLGSSNSWTLSENTTLDLNYGSGTGLSSGGNIIVNGGSLGTTINRSITGTGNTTLLSSSGSLQLNGLVNINNTDSSTNAGNLVFGGLVDAKANSTVNLTTNDDAGIVFNHNLNIGENALVTGKGDGNITFDQTVTGFGTDSGGESRLVLEDNLNVTVDGSTALSIMGEACSGLEIEARATVLQLFVDAGALGAIGSSNTGTLTLRSRTNGLTVDDGPNSSSTAKLGLASNATQDITITLDNSGNDLNTWGGLIVKGNSANSTIGSSTADFDYTTRVEVTGGDIDLSGQTGSVFKIKEGILDTNDNNITVDGDAEIRNGDLIGNGGSFSLTADTITINANTGFEVTVEADLDATTLDIQSGTLVFAENGGIANGTNVVLSGGNLSTGTFTMGSSDVLGTLTLSAASTLDLGNGSTRINFADSKAESWVGSTNYWDIENWSGDAINGGGTDQIFFGSDDSALNAIQIAQIRFINPDGFGPGIYEAQLLPTGELVPVVPEPSTYLGGALLALAAILFEFRRRKQNKS